jgi:putative addiction module killer protein
MVEILRSETLDRWLKRLRDSEVKTRILMRIRRLSLGNPGDVQPVGDGLFEIG